MKRLRALHGRALDLSGTLAGLAYGAIAAFMCIDIAVRSLGLGTLGWLTELTEYLLYAATFIAAAWALRQGAHVRVDALLVWLGPWRARRLERAMDAVGLAISAVLAGFGGVAVLEAWRAGAIQYKYWATPEWLLLLPLPLAGVMLGVEFALRLGGAPEAVRGLDPAKRASL